METHYFTMEGMAFAASQLPLRQISVGDLDAAVLRAKTADFGLVVEGNRCMSARRDPVTGIVKIARSAGFAHLAPDGDDLRPTVANMALAGVRADGPLTAAQMFALGNPGSVVEEATAAATCRKVLALDVPVAPGLHRCWRRVAKTATSPEQLVCLPGTPWQGRPDITPEPVSLCIVYSIMVASAPAEVDAIGDNRGDGTDAHMLCIDIDADTPPEATSVAYHPGWSPAVAAKANQPTGQASRSPAEASVHPAPSSAAPTGRDAQPVPLDACPAPKRPKVSFQFVGFHPPISEMWGGAECHLFEAVLVIEAMLVVWFFRASYRLEAGPYPIGLQFGVVVLGDDDTILHCPCRCETYLTRPDLDVDGLPEPTTWPDVTDLSLAAGTGTNSLVVMSATLPKRYLIAAKRGQLRVAVTANKFRESTEIIFDAPIRIV